MHRNMRRRFRRKFDSAGWNKRQPVMLSPREVADLAACVSIALNSIMVDGDRYVKLGNYMTEQLGALTPGDGSQ